MFLLTRCGLLVACTLVLLFTSTGARAEVSFLPQTSADLQPQQLRALLPPAPQTTVEIPSSRLVAAPAKAANVIRLASGQSKVVALDEDAASVIVANPSHATVFLDSARTLVIVPRAIGATNFKVLNRQGRVIMNQPIVIDDSENEHYVRITRICGGTANCQASTTYFCPDNCVPIAVPQPEANVAYPTIPPIAALPPLPELPVSGSIESTGMPQGVQAPAPVPKAN